MLKDAIKKIPGAMTFARSLGLVPDELEGRRFLLEKLPKNSIGVEVGVHLGDFSQLILQVVSPRELYLIDPWKHETSSRYNKALYGGQASGQMEMDDRYAKVCARFDEEIRNGVVKIHRGYSTDGLNQLPHAYLDWVYIDGNHLYEYVKSDLELSFRKTKVGGYLTGDDYTEGGWWAGGVKKAVDEFATCEAVELIEVANRQFIFRKTREMNLSSSDEPSRESRR